MAQYEVEDKVQYVHNGTASVGTIVDVGEETNGVVIYEIANIQTEAREYVKESDISGKQ